MRLGWLSILFIALVPGTALADPAAINSDYTADLPRLADIQTLQTPASDLDRLFAQAMADIQKSNVAAAADRLDTLKTQSLVYGYSDLNAFSGELIKYASSLTRAEQLPLKAFLIRRAVDLSPNDGASLIAAASFLDVFGWRASLGYALQGVFKSAGTPLALGKVGTNLLLLLLVACSLSFLFVASLQIVAHREEVFTTLSNRLRLSFRGLATPVLMVAIVTLPLLGGILLALGIWSLLISRSLKHCRWLGVLSAAIIFSWALSVPLVQTIGLNTNSRLLRVVQDLNSGSYAPGAEKVLSSAAERNPQSPYLPFNLAMFAYHQSDPARSAELFQLTALHPESPASLRRAALVNLAVNQYQLQNFAKAKEALLEAQGKHNSSVTILYNLAQVEAALTNTEAFRDYYNAAADMDRTAVLGFDEAWKNRQALMMIGFPKGLLYRWFTKDIRETGAVDSQQQMLTARENIYRALMISGTPGSLLLFGLVVLAGSGLNRRNGRRITAYSSDRQRMEPALIWALIPAGLSLVSTKPVQGGILLGIILAAVITGFQQPVQFLAVTPVAVISTKIWFITAAALAFVIGILDAAPRLLRKSELAK